MSDILDLINFQDAINQIAREGKVGRETLADIERMREWQFEVRCYSALHVRMYAEKSAGNFIRANHIKNVLEQCQPRWRALDERQES